MARVSIIATNFLVYALLIFGTSFLIMPSTAVAAVKDLKLTDKKTGKNFVLGKLKHKNRNITAFTYKPANVSKPITGLVFDRFSLAEYVSDPVEKALLYNFQFQNAVIIAVPKGSDVHHVTAHNLPAPIISALGGSKSPLFPLEFRHGVNFAGIAGLKKGSTQEALLNSMGVKKTRHVVKGRFTDDFLDITGLVLPKINLSLKALLARLKLDFSIPNLKPDFYLPFKFANSRFDISRERDLLGNTTGAIVAALQSDIFVHMPGLGDSVYPAVRIKGRLETGITFGSLHGIDFPKLFNLPWASLTDVRLHADVIRKKPLGPPVLKVGLTAKGRVNNVRNIPVEAFVEIEASILGHRIFLFHDIASILVVFRDLRTFQALKALV